MVPTRSSLHRPLPTNETSSSFFFVTLFLSLVGLSVSSSSSAVPVELTSFQCGLLHQHKRRDCRVVREKWKTSASVSHTATATSTSSYSGIIRKASQSHHHASKNDSSSTTKLYNSGSSSISNNENNNGEEEIQRILRRYGFGNRLVTLNHADLLERPMPAEIYEGGGWKICLIVGLKPPSSSSNNRNSIKPPLLDIVSMDDGGILQEKKVVDIGQITTLWHDMNEISPSYASSPSTVNVNINKNALTDNLQSNIQRAQKNLQNNIFSVEKAMQNLYNGRIANRSQQQQRSHNNKNRQRQQSYALTKKQIPKIASQLSNNNNSNQPTTATQQHLEELLRNLLKVGEDRLSRLVDSTMATEYLYSDYARDGDGNELIIRRMVGATVLAEDAVSGGRFKRRSCQFVSANYYSEEIDDAEEENHAGVVVEEVTLVNGGWIAVDPSIKAGTEGRKFAATTAATITSSSVTNANGKTDGGVGRRSEKPPILTAADERIAHRLECLAMGDAWKSGDDNSNRRRRRREDEEEEDGDEKMLELDVRMALKSMNLPLTPQGATSALVKLGRWSSSSASSSSGTTTDGKKNKKKTNGGSSVVEPWSPELLDAARSLALYEGKRRESLANNCFGSSSSSSSKQKKKGSNNKTQQRASLADGFEGRVDLSSLPCVCIDAKRATFRDDSIGVRLRSSTGRKVNKSASKWEILIHIADVSDVYFDGGKFDANIIVPSKKDVNNMHLLREASERRGQSRYDLPLGPLHLLPPVALTALSLVTNKEKTPNRCVTLWVYIDERDGKLLEAGLERTIISSPTALSFTDATTLLGSTADKVPKSMSNSKAVLSVAERNLSLWSQRHMQRDRAAQKKEKRRSTRELISKELSAAAGNQARDDGVGGSFQRSRGHRIVDSSLDVYAFAVGTLMRRANQPIPRAAGSGADRGGRLGTAPLRRYIDGLAQRQALSVLCGYGTPLTKEECIEASKVAARASDNIANLRSSKQSPMMQNEYGNQRRQVSALYKLARHLASTGGIQNRQRVKAVSTGHNNEVVILGAGATARCKGVKGTLKSGEKLLVRVDKIDPEVGVLNVSLV